MTMEKRSCFASYAKGDPLIEKYHDEEWGLPCRDEDALTEMFILETFQAGLSWKTILHKREGFRRAFDGFDADRIAEYGPDKIAELMSDPAIIRNRAKISGAVTNCRVILELRDKFGSFCDYLWHFTGDETIYEDASVTRNELSDDVSADMKKRGMKFVGSVTIYSFLQSVGIIYSHPEDCWRFEADGASRFIHNTYRDGKVVRR
jgi:DNA-3-methyladenine glycosylase I